MPRHFLRGCPTAMFTKDKGGAYYVYRGLMGEFGFKLKKKPKKKPNPVIAPQKPGRGRLQKIQPNQNDWPFTNNFTIITGFCRSDLHICTAALHWLWWRGWSLIWKWTWNCLTISSIVVKTKQCLLLVYIVETTGVCQACRIVDTTYLSASRPAPASELKNSLANKPLI